jgi:hypothetical protein
MDLSSFALNIIGSTLLGVGVGQVAMLALPDFSVTDKDIETSLAMGLAKQTAQVIVRSGIDIFMLYKLSEYVLPTVGGNDPTNGAFALIMLLHSDTKLMSDIRNLSKHIHSTIQLQLTGKTHDEISNLDEQNQQKVTDKLVDVVNSTLQKAEQAFGLKK